MFVAGRRRGVLMSDLTKVMVCPQQTPVHCGTAAVLSCFPQIQETAHQLFAERGFEAVTTEDIASAAGISISTYFRYAPTKEGLLIDPVREAAAEIVGRTAPGRNTSQQSEALIQLAPTNLRQGCQRGRQPRYLARCGCHRAPPAEQIRPGQRNRSWRADRADADRMGVDAAADIRPALSVHTSLATVQFVLDGWLTSDIAESPPFHVRLEEALRITLAGFD